MRTFLVRRAGKRRWCWPGLALLGLVGVRMAAGAEWKEAQQQLLSGNYTGCIAEAKRALKGNSEGEEWQLLLSEALLATGRYPEALEAITNAVAEDAWSLRLTWQAHKVLAQNGQAAAAKEMVDRIVRRVASHPRDYRDAPSLVVFGQAALLAGADPKRVLDTLFEAARRQDPKLRDVYLASGQLALDKHDYELAAKRFQEGLKELPNDPDLNYGLAQAYAPSDGALMNAALDAALQRNSNHVGSLLLLADHYFDAEQYDACEKTLDRVMAVNPWQPEACAYRALLAHFHGQPEAEETARQAGLKFAPTSPRVDHLIGRKLSQNYRFTEGAAHQRQALKFDPDNLPAKAQLAEDLLRLGDESEGWKLIDEVQKRDAYDVEAFNLANLHDTMGRCVTRTNADFLLRMSSREAMLYGDRVLELLERARRTLSAKYGCEPKRPTIVEVFAEQKDFAVRTFGMPGNPGYLGVCFGSVITANSPAAHPGHPVNWQAVLYHEFCHVITLQLTRNKMPRWLSEGISVYEELQANPAWGQHMDPRYREMVLGDDLTPISKLSGAFLDPRSDLHLQFAYYESALVVEFIVQRFGLEQLKAILGDLGQGVEINQAIAKHTAPMGTLEQDFAAFAHQRAQQLAPGLDFEQPDSEPMTALGNQPSPPRGRSPGTNNPVAHWSRETSAADWDAFAKSHPTNFWVMMRQARQASEAKRWSEAKPLLEQVVALYPDFTGPESAYRLLAAAHRALGETNAEHEVLARFAERDDVATDAFLRLMELNAAAKDWPAVMQNAERYLAVDPLVPAPYRFLAQASEETAQPPVAIAAYRALLQLDPPDPAETHFRLARALHHTGDPAARRQVLEALEDAPRYPAALRLLLEINGEAPSAGVNTAEATAQAKP